MLHEVGGNHLKYLKRGWNGKEGRGNKDFKKGWQAGSRGECLKNFGVGGVESYYIYLYISISICIIYISLATGFYIQ